MPEPREETELSKILSPQRVAVNLRVASKKRLLEKMAELLQKGDTGLVQNDVLQVLIERERLGSTGIGHGVALPHGRVPGLEQAIGAFATLEQPVDFDAIDTQPVSMIFVLVVPAEATDHHLKLLAQLASMFSDAEFRKTVLSKNDAEEMYACLAEWSAPPRVKT
jgi:PTS system nitrogen regulatory IIA component